MMKSLSPFRIALQWSGWKVLFPSHRIQLMETSFLHPNVWLAFTSRSYLLALTLRIRGFSPSKKMALIFGGSPKKKTPLATAKSQVFFHPSIGRVLGIPSLLLREARIHPCRPAARFRPACRRSVSALALRDMDLGRSQAGDITIMSHEKKKTESLNFNYIYWLLNDGILINGL